MERDKQHYLISKELEEMHEPKDLFYETVDPQTSQKSLSGKHIILMLLFLVLVVGGVVVLARI
jgi:hypothetical protein